MGSMADVRGDRTPTSAPVLGPVVEIASRRFAVPFQCPCCGAAPDAELAVPVTRVKGRTVAEDSARGLDFPYCRRCLAHIETWQGAGVVSAGITLAGIVLGLAISILVHVIGGLLMVVAAIIVAYGLVTNRRAQATAQCSPACPSADTAVTYFGWSGSSSSFAFRSPTYTARFAEDNTAKLVNASSGLRRLLEGHRVARLAVPTPAATMIVPPPRTGPEWLVRIENAPTRIARRHDLHNALELIQDTAERRDLVRAATRAELAPVRTKLERLSGEARASYLEQAIRAVAVDNVPAELQRSVLAELEALRAP
jgi:hypothetical protein